jgi:hypothetical protein
MGETGLKRGIATGLALAVALALAGGSSAQPPTVSEPAAPPVDQCGAADLAWLVGRPRTDIPVPTQPGRRRVYCTSCTVTMDYDPTRQDILFDADTGVVKAVKCG